MTIKDSNCYTRLYGRKIMSEFGSDFLESLDAPIELYPLVYACLKHRFIPRMKRMIYIADGVEQLLSDNKHWKNLKKKIENGDSINNYISKRTRIWNNADFLFFACNIYHVHLRQSSAGGIDDGLIYAIIKDDSFYVIHYGNHHDIFDPGELVQICDLSWPKLHFDVKIDHDQSDNYFDKKFYTQNICNPKLGFNLLKPIKYIDKNTGEHKYVSNHQNTDLVSYTYKNNEWKLPLKCAASFSEEEPFIYGFINRIFHAYGVVPDSLELDHEKREYIFKFPTIRGHGDYREIRVPAPNFTTISFPYDAAEVNWQKKI